MTDKYLTDYEKKQQEKRLKLNEKDLNMLFELVDHQINYYREEFEKTENEADKDYFSDCYGEYVELRLKLDNIYKKRNESGKEIDEIMDFEND